MIRNKLFGLMFAAGLLAMPAASQAAVDLEITVAPPAERVEVVPAPREGYVWERGYYRWDGDGQRHVWVDGRYIPNREGHKYIQGEWRHEGEKWRFSAGHWDND